MLSGIFGVGGSSSQGPGFPSHEADVGLVVNDGSQRPRQLYINEHGVGCVAVEEHLDIASRSLISRPERDGHRLSLHDGRVLHVNGRGEVHASFAQELRTDPGRSVWTLRDGILSVSSEGNRGVVVDGRGYAVLGNQPNCRWQLQDEGHAGHRRAPGHGQIMPLNHEGYVAGPANSSMAAVAQLFARLSQEIEEKQPPNCIHFMVDFLCKHYPEHLHGFASIWNMDPDLERERHEVVNFFKSHKISTAVAAHFTNAGYDTLDTLTTLSVDQLVDVEAFNNVKWLPGHKVRLQQIFSEIPARVRAYRQAHPTQTAQVVGPQSAPHQVPHHPMPHPGAAAHGSPALAIGNAPTGGPREYVVGVSEPVRIQPAPSMAPPMMATGGVGAHQPMNTYAPAHGAQLALPSHGAPMRPMQGQPVAVGQMPQGQSMHLGNMQPQFVGR